MTSILQDLRYTLRLFAKSPGSYAVAVLSLAVAIGPNTFLFSALNAILLHPWPVSHQEQLFGLNLTKQSRPEPFSYPDFSDFERRATLVSGMTAWRGGGGFLTLGGQREIVSSTYVSSNYFPVLGVQPALGRFFGPGDEKYFQTDPPVVLAYSLWQRKFGGEKKLLGQRIRLDERDYTVVGIAPRGFKGLHWIMPAELWAPLESSPRFRSTLAQRGRPEYDVMVRLKPGVTAEQALAELNAIAAGIGESYPDTNRGKRAELRDETKSRTKQGLLISSIILTLVGLVLLVACANVAGLLLSRAEARRRETAIRLAIGSGRWRLVRQLLTESLLLSLLAGALGCMLALWLITLIPALMPPIPLPLNYDIRIDGVVLLYTLLLSLVTAVMFGLAPALQTTRANLTPALKDMEPQVRRGLLRFTLRGALAVAQIFVSVFLLVAAGLLFRSYCNTFEARVGFDAGKPILLVWGGSYGKVDHDMVAERLQGLPAVKRASFSRHFPMSGSGVVSRKVTVPGSERFANGTPESVRYNVAGLRYFETIGTRLLRGRGFERLDGPNSGKVVVINQTMADRYWPRQDPLGKQLDVEGAPHRVIGVVENGKYDTMRESPQPFMFFAYGQNPGGEAAYLIETAVAPASIATAARQAMSAAAPQLQVFHVVTLAGQMRVARYVEEMSAGVLGVVAGLAIFLASVGLFGVVATVMGRRRKEFGIRMALGATRWNVMKIVYAHGLKLVCAGLSLGLIGALLVMRLFSSGLYEVQPGDPLTYLGVSALVAGITLAACHFPALRATRVNPSDCLRSE